MTVSEFALYVINNISRATLQNALKIGDRLTFSESSEKYAIVDFCNSLLSELLKELDSNKIPPTTAYRAIIACDDCLNRVKSCNSYTFQMICDDLIIQLWEAFNGSPRTEKTDPVQQNT